MKKQKDGPRGFRPARKKAEKLAKDKASLTALVDHAIDKASRHKGPLGKSWDDLNSLFRLITAWITGQYSTIPWQTIVLAIAAVVYFVNPFDLIPDFIPIVGYVDDATVVAFVIASIKTDINRFREWEQSLR